MLFLAALLVPWLLTLPMAGRLGVLSPSRTFPSLPRNFHTAGCSPLIFHKTPPTPSLAGKGQNCTGQKCTEHELVLLMFFVLKCLDDLLWGFKMPLVGLLWLLVHHQINNGSNKLLMEVVKSAQSTSSCFYFNSYLGWPKSLLEL